MAEREGFEPPEPCGSAVFKTAAIDHSATSPCSWRKPQRNTALVELSRGRHTAGKNRAGLRVFAVEEMQGLYGPFTFSEKLLQQIWARGDFNQTDLRTTDGRCLQVLQAGRWKRLGGPDFKAARLRFDDGREITAAVELHLRADDWIVHRHAQDRAYDQVKLHVVLFPPATEHSTRDAQGRKIPVCCRYCITTLRNGLASKKWTPI